MDLHCLVRSVCPNRIHTIVTFFTSRLVAKFNHSHRVEDIRRHITSYPFQFFLIVSCPAWYMPYITSLQQLWQGNFVKFHGSSFCHNVLKGETKCPIDFMSVSFVKKSKSFSSA